jgi:membrane protease YdiL (CAAX protease family)
MNSRMPKKEVRYSVIFFLLVTIIAFVSPWLGGSPSSPGPGFILWGTAPLLVAMLMRTVTRDWSDAGLKPAIRENALWYGLTILAVPVMMGFTLLSGTMTSAASISGFSMGTYLNLVLPGIGVFFIFAVFEEFGWRGYLVPKLASSGMNRFLAYAIVTIVWATWHMPYIRELTWVTSGSEELITAIPRLYLMFFAYAILYYELRLVTGSVWPAVLLHCLTNAIQHPLAADFLKIVPGMEYLVSFNGLFIIGLVGLVGIALNRWRMRKVAGTSRSFARGSGVTG